jgi:hypothetical protein
MSISLVLRMPDFGFDQAGLGSDVTSAQTRIDDPNIRDAETQIVVDLLLHVHHGVIFGKNLDAEMGPGSEDIALHLGVLVYGDIWDSYSSSSDLDATLLDFMLRGVSREINDHFALSYAVRLFA